MKYCCRLLKRRSICLRRLRLRQLLLLSKLIHADPRHKLDIAQAARLARDLAAFLAELQTEHVAFDAFRDSYPKNLPIIGSIH